MKITDLDLLLQHFGEQKEAIGGGYYRLRKTDAHTYQLAYLVDAECSTTNYHPQITVEVTDEEITPTTLIDTEVTPAKMMSYNEETASELEQALDQLVEQFKTAKNLV